MKRILITLLALFFLYPTFAQEVQVTDNSSATTLVDGTSTINFGAVNVGSTTSRTFTLDNTDAANELTLTTPLVISGDYTVTTQPTSPVATSGSTTFTIQFAPTAAGTRAGTVSFANNDADENPFNFNLTGIGVSLNTAPTASSFTANPSESLVYTFATGDFSYNDTDSDPLDNLLIEVPPTSGTLFVDADDNNMIGGGETLGASGTVSLADLDAGRLKYLQNGSTNTSFQFEVSDGTNVSTGDYIATLNMLAVPTVTLGVLPTSRIESIPTNVNITATLSNSYGANVTVNLGFSGTATGGGVDYTASATSITINSGSTSNSTTITNDDDALFEGNETVVIDITGVTNGTEDGVQQATYTIIDNESAPNVTFELLGIYNPTSEDGGVAYVSAELDAASGVTTTVPVSFSGSATQGTDYSISSSNIVIDPGDTKDSISVTGLTDAFIEGDESIVVDMGAPTNGNEDGVQQVSFTLTDEDAATISIADVSTNEGASGATVFTFTVTATTGAGVTIPGGFTVDYATSNGTATAGSDYTAASGTLTFSGTSNETQTFTVTVAGDEVVEADETFTATLSNIVVSGGRDVSFSDATAIGTITNDDVATVTIADVAVDENSGTATITLTVDNAVDGGFDVDVSTSDGTATTADSDYTSVTNFTQTFAGTAAEQETFTVTLGSDTKVETDETVTISMSSPSPATVDAGDIDISDDATLTLDNDDQATVTIANVSGDEDDGAITLTAILDVAVDGGFDIDVSTTDGSATTADNDYTAVTNFTLTFDGFASEQETFTVTPTSDATVESDETITVSMSGLAPVTVAGGDIDVSDDATVTILNDDDVSFSVNDPSVSEGDAGSATLTFTVTLSAPAPAGGATVDYITSDGTASSASDYTAIGSTTLSFGVGTTTQTVDVTVAGDELVELDETITLTLSNPTGTDVVISDGTGTGTITNDDAATVTIADVAVNENSGTATITLTVDNAVDGGFSVDVSTSDGTATTADSDYSSVTNATETFAGTASETETFTVTLGGDSKVELDETVTITMSSLVPSTVDPSDIDITDTGTLTLNNDDAATVTIADVAVNENSGIATITLTVDNAVDGGFDVDVSTSDGSATTADGDYSSVTNFTQTFLGTAAEQETFTVTLGGDTKVEIDETVNISMSNLSPATVDPGDIDVTDGATLTLNNDDAATVTIADVAVNENNGTATITLTLDNAVDGGFDVDVSTSDGTATTADNDYSSVTNATETFAGTASETETFTVTLGGDTKVEVDETVTISMSSLVPTTVASGDIDITDGATLTLNNDDIATVTIADVAVNENSGTATITLTVDNAVDGGFDVDVSTSDGTATTADSDYSSVTNATETFTGTASETETFTVTLGGDTKVEADETVTISMSTLVPTTVDAGDIDISDDATLTLNNDDQATLTIENESGNEDDGAVTFTVTLDNAVDGGLTVDVNTADGTATIADSDYTAVTSQTLTFAGTASETETFTVTPTTDAGSEPNETVNINMDNVVAATVDVGDIDESDTAILTILNDDNISFSVNDPSVSEGDAGSATLTFTVTLDNPAPAGGATVDYATSDGTASSASDYTAISTTTLSFSAGETSQTVDVTVAGDETVEVDETITLTLSNPTGTDVVIGDATGSGTITNDDEVTVTVADITPNENGTFTLTLSADNAVDGGFSLGVTTADGTATAGSDYTALVSEAVTFAGTANETETVTIIVSDDNVVEADETITISLDSKAAGTVDTGDIDITDGATATITNDDVATLTILDETEGEGSGSVVFRVTVDNAVDGGFTVDVNTADGTATIADSDYTAVTGQTLTFAGTAGESEIFAVNPIDDSTPELDETVNISMDNVTAGTVDVADIDESDGAILTILNNDNIEASVNDPSVAEGDAGSTTLQFTVTLSAPALAGGLTVDYETIDGTASSASDYTAISATTLSFLEGETSKTVDVTVSGDELVEVDETLSLGLSNPTGNAAAIGDGLGIGTITNDDVATVTIADVAVNENSGTATITLTVDNAVDGGFDVDVSTSDGTATTADGDYTSVTNFTQTFAGTASETETFTVTLGGDTKVETDETVTISMSTLLPATVDAGDIDITDGATLTLNNDDAATVTIADVAVNENSGTATITLTLDNAVDGGFDVDVSTADGTATTADGDYTSVTNFTQTFAGTASETETFTVTLGGDTKVEADETVSISMSTLVPNTVASGDIDITDGATLTLNNDDAATVTIADVIVNENSGTATITLTLDNAVDGGFDVDVSTSDGTATIADNDYTSVTNLTQTFAGTASETETFTVTLGGDTKVEADETVTISMSTLLPTTVASGDIDITDGAILTLENDDQATVTITDVSPNENDGTVDVTFTLNVEVDGGLDVDVSTSDGTATTLDNDYVEVTGQTMTFAGSASEEEIVTFTITGDTKVEADETVNLSLSGLSPGTVDAGDIDITDTGTITIVNDDQATVTVADVSVLEGDGTAQVVLTLNGEVDGGFDVDVSTNDNTAQVADLDYAAQVSASETFTGTDGETQSLDITIGTDGKVEADELIDIILSNVVAGTVDASDIDITDDAMVTIVNDDQASVTIADVIVNEADGTATLTLTLDTEVDGGFNVDVSTADNTATLADNDYTAVSSNTESFTGTGGETQTFDVAITDDSKVELDELIDIAMSNVTATTVDPADIFVTDEATVTINNDDVAAVTIADVSGNENDGDITVTAVLDNAVQGGFTVEINSADGTATTADSDYSALSGEVLTFTGTAGEMQTFTLSPTADTKLETDENLTLSMSNLGATSLTVDITDDATVTINNDDNASVTIADISGNENDGNITVTATLDNAVQGGFSVDVSTADGTATVADADYASVTAQSLNFAGTAGETQTFTITVGADTKVEADETLSISQSNLTGSTLPIDITDGATVTIINDDQATVTIADLTVSEDVGFATVTVSLDAEVDGGFSVDATFSDNTATAADNDYDATTTTETEVFAGIAAETQTFDIRINNDSKVEADELISLALSNLVVATVDASDINITSTANVTITNDDNASVDITDVTVNEGDGTATLTVSVNNAVQGGFTIDANTAAVEASSADNDFTALTDETITFAGTAGETQNVNVTIIDDNILELDETFTVNLSNIQATTADASDISILDNASVSITDNDNAAVTMTSISVTEDDGSATVTLSLDNAVQGGFTIDVNSADGTATTADNDYTALVSETVTFAGTAGETQTVNISIGVDNKIESDESFFLGLSNAVATEAPSSEIGASAGASVTITNDDNAAVTITDATGAEDGGAITLTATLDNPVDGGFTVEINTVDGSATIADNDYTEISSQVLTFSGTAGETQTFTVAPTADGVEEADENLTISMGTLAATSLPIDVSDDATVTITNDDSTPVITASQSFTIDENLADASSVGTVLATDADAGTTFQNWTIVSGNTDVDGDTNGAFAINAASGEITVNDSGDLDFESGTTSYTLTLTVSDGDNTSAEETVTITVEDVNDILPVVTAGQTFTIDENLANMTSVGTLNATDADVTATTLGMWMITSGNDAGIFAIDASSGEITIADNSNLDRESFENIVLTVTVNDGVNTSTPETVQININDLNDVLPVVTASQTLTINENAANDTSLGSVQATDADVTSTTFSNWTIVSGNTDGIFAIDAASGEITVADNSNLDFESVSVYTLVVTVSDGSNTSAEENITINITNDNEVPVITGLADLSFDEDTDGTTSFTVADPDTDLADLQFSFAVDTEDVFVTSGVTVTGDGADRVLNIVPNDNQFGTTELTVTVSDGELSSEVTITVVVNPVNDVPASLTLSNQTIDEDVSVGFEIGTFTTDDIDVSDTHTYTLVSGDGDTDNAVFSINGDALELAEMVDFEEGETRSIRVRTTDSAGDFIEETFTITLVANPDLELVIKTAFTPNGDGVNDTWIIDNITLHPNSRVTILNREGRTVFESVGYQTPWDGTFEGKELPVDTYYYVIDLETGGRRYEGFVMILK